MTDPAPDQKPAAPGERRPVAMTPYAIAVALFAAFVVGGILAKVVPLWLVTVLGLAVGAARLPPGQRAVRSFPPVRPVRAPLRTARGCSGLTGAAPPTSSAGRCLRPADATSFTWSPMT